MQQKSITNCKEKSEIVIKLEDWAKYITNASIVFAAVLIIAGLITGIYMADAISQDRIFWETFLPYVLYAIIDIGSCIAISLLLRALASITHNTEITARLTELGLTGYRENNEEPLINTAQTSQKDNSTPAREEKKDLWECSRCGEKNTGRFCSACGYIKSREVSQNTVSESSGLWTCPDCGRHNMNINVCSCGCRKPQG